MNNKDTVFANNVFIPHNAFHDGESLKAKTCILNYMNSKAVFHNNTINLALLEVLKQCGSKATEQCNYGQGFLLWFTTYKM